MYIYRYIWYSALKVTTEGLFQVAIESWPSVQTL